MWTVSLVAQAEPDTLRHVEPAQTFRSMSLATLMIALARTPAYVKIEKGSVAKE